MTRKLVFVRWHDSSQPRSCWQYVSDLEEPKPVACESVGWLVAETKQAVSLAPNFAEVDNESIQVSGVITIPRRAIISTRRLESR